MGLPVSYRTLIMLCHIYRSERKPDIYLYLTDKDDFSEIPDELMKVFGTPEFSFTFDLSPHKKLAREDVTQVLANLETRGYHLQLQDDLLVEQMLAMKAAN